MPELRKKISDLYGRWYNLDLDPSRVIVTSGSSGAFILSFTALFEEGARVGIGAPGYPSYRQILKSLGISPVDILTNFENKFQPTAKDVVSQNLDGLLVASPSNPTGTMLSKDELTDLIDASHSIGANFISDEIYHGVQYEKKAVSALEVTDECYVINSFSKFFSMTGWRVGWMVVPQNHIRLVERLAQNLFICSPHVSQVAALEAMSCEEELSQNLTVYHKNRKIIMDGLQHIGLQTFAPPELVEAEKTKTEVPEGLTPKKEESKTPVPEKEPTPSKDQTKEIQQPDIMGATEEDTKSQVAQELKKSDALSESKKNLEVVEEDTADLKATLTPQSKVVKLATIMPVAFDANDIRVLSFTLEITCDNEAGAKALQNGLPLFEEITIQIVENFLNKKFYNDILYVKEKLQKRLKVAYNKKIEGDSRVKKIKFKDL